MDVLFLLVRLRFALQIARLRRVLLKSRGNRRCAASGGRSEPVSRKRRCLWTFESHKQQCRNGVHPTKVSLANIPFLADNRRFCVFFINANSKGTPPIRVVFLCDAGLLSGFFIRQVCRIGTEKSHRQMLFAEGGAYIIGRWSSCTFCAPDREKTGGTGVR